MRLVLHPKIYSDIDKIIDYYERVATTEGSERNFTPSVDRSKAEYEECHLEWSWILIGTSGGGGRDSESVQAS